jgi:hypothetical protein
VKFLLANRHVVRVVESHLRQFQAGAERNYRLGAQFFRLCGVPGDRQQGIGRIVVHHRNVAGKIGGDQALGWIGLPVIQQLSKRLGYPSGPFPRRCVE